MRMAVDESMRHWGETSPNPSVGTVLVKNNKVIGKSVTAIGGRPHSEAALLQKLGRKAFGSTMYVTLEPCSHYGRTPPCAELVVKSGLAKVFVGMKDPNPLVNGKGIRIIRNAGIPVELGLLKNECAEVNEWFFKKFHSQYPYVIVKAALSWDGKIATQKGDSKWISSEESRGQAHFLRRTVDAVIVGKGTVLADNPSLNVRNIVSTRNPHKVVLDREGDLSASLEIFKSFKGEQVFYFTSKKCKNRFHKVSHIRHIPVSIDRRGLNLKEILLALKAEGVDSILSEGGGSLNASLLEQGFVDKVILFLAPKLIGGKEAPTFFEGHGADTVMQALRLKDISVTQMGNDMMLKGFLRRYA